MKPEINPRDDLLASIPGALVRKPKGKKPTWQRRLMGSLVEGEDGKWRPAPEKEDAIQAAVDEYARLKGLFRYRVPSELLRALFARAGLLDRLLWSLPKESKVSFYPQVQGLRKRVKEEMAGLPDDLFLDPRRQADGSHRALAMEIKTLAGVVSKDQRTTHAAMGGVHVPRSTEEGIALIDKFINKEST